MTVTAALGRERRVSDGIICYASGELQSPSLTGRRRQGRRIADTPKRWVVANGKYERALRVAR